ncbi:methyltransferase domain-containing protein [Geodermatophilus aquaeductus]|uniref:Methyltransferase domain-containing protein n=1 Tax=Geodermatophilus aquaeductus TaxID=1564161 RepID=A0A521C7K8_9ACTN|nr:class I SAM-dependent methyltransferase [Geodermatophilus aquaeductus]SMO55419.1 Methyltransferase domain-containing protein [Geodermatophilus aquaeductus]
MDDAPGYVLGNDDPAMVRLDALSRVYEPATAAWLDAAELTPGASVVDLGCGTGAVTLAAAERVGPPGRVVGVDTAPLPLAVARRRAAEAGHGGVSFEQADVTTWAPPGPVDAVLGRLVLLHLPDPVALLARLARSVRPGGVVAFQEVVLSTRAAVPPLPLLTAFNGWLLTALGRLGVPADLGLRLGAVFRAAGLPDPVLVTGQPLEHGGDATGWSIVGGDVTALAGAFERTGTATAGEVGPADFEQRLRAQAAAADAVLVDPLVVGAVARVP